METSPAFALFSVRANFYCSLLVKHQYIFVDSININLYFPFGMINSAHTRFLTPRNMDRDTSQTVCVYFPWNINLFVALFGATTDISLQVTDVLLADNPPSNKKNI